ncbi:hypothetical protein QJS04_geneDACA003633 [Acorus gramineus]|uniref:Protein DGS1, mitochondrial n=2 Tax=Acorus TaxID=4464 RepID=A0AAV9BRL1_ACOGR|nr:hypothetical protein QJS04_geneDACA003633 [Acorus gramineus]
MATSSSRNPNSGSNDVKALVTSYSSRLWNSLLRFLPSSDSILGLYSRRTTGSSSRSLRRRRKLGLPLPLHSNSLESSSVISDASRVYCVLEDILGHVLSSLHDVQKNLQFWQSRAEGTDAQKAYFMLFERGPRAFVDRTFQLVRRHGEGPTMQRLSHSAAVMISENISILMSLQSCLAKFLAQVYVEVEKFGGALSKEPEQSLPLLLVNVNSLFSKLEASISHPPEIYKSDYSLFGDESNSCALLFERLPGIDQERSQWTDTEVRDAINLIYENLQRLDSYLAFIVSRCQKPRNLTLYWLHYTCGAVGLSICSVWLLRHSSLMGSPDIDNWIHEAKESTTVFWKDHVEQPILSIRDELFETFRRRHKGVMELDEVQLTAISLRRMLLAFSEQTKGQKLPVDASDQELLEIVMARYEEELVHPIQNLVKGELVRGLLIQVQKLKLDIETAMLELNQILKANEINFAILAALPAFFLSLALLMLVRTWITQDKGAEGKGRIARLQRRLLVVEVEKRIMQYQTCLDQGQDEDAQCAFGLVLYSLDRLYRAVERHARATGEWLSLRQDIVDLGKPGFATPYKLAVTSRMERVYDCLLPSSKRR